MKQNISSSQLNELSDKGKEKIIDYLLTKGGGKMLIGKYVMLTDISTLLSIGQCLEYLREEAGLQSSYFAVNEEFIDTLWKDVKNHLDSKGQ